MNIRLEIDSKYRWTQRSAIESQLLHSQVASFEEDAVAQFFRRTLISYTRRVGVAAETKVPNFLHANRSRRVLMLVFVTTGVALWSPSYLIRS